jgi:superoxide dismutase, Cu-Zn family
MPHRRIAIVAALLAAGGAAGIASADDGPRDRDRDRGHDRGARDGDGRHGGHHGRSVAAVTLRTADGDAVGRVWMHERRRSGTVTVMARVRGLTPGFHGFHVHTAGRCEPPGFTSAGGHLNPDGSKHGDHAGDLPSLLVNADGTGILATATDRFSLADLRDADGSAVMVHSGRDNFANIPPRYGEPDAETLDTGDSGTRVACGVVR